MEATPVLEAGASCVRVRIPPRPLIYANMSELVDETGSNPVANKRESSNLSVGIWCRSHLIQIESDGC